MKVQRDTTPKSGWRPLGSALLFAAMAVILIWLSAGDGEYFSNGLMLAAGAVLCALLDWQGNGAWNAAFSCAPCYWSADSQWSGRKSCDAGAVDYPGALFHMDADPVV